MRVTEDGLRDLAAEEGKHTIAYPDPASPLGYACTAAGISFLNGGYRRLAGWERMSGHPWTVGIGQTGANVREGTVWTDAQVMAAFRESVKVREDYINATIKVPLTQGQFNALLSWAFNTSGPDGATFKRSTLVRKLNEGDYAGASAEFPKWCIPSMLIKRRERERAMFDGASVRPIVPAHSTEDVQRFFGLTVDGLYGPATKSAVVKFQQERGLTVDGLVGPRTLAVMFPEKAAA